MCRLASWSALRAARAVQVLFEPKALGKYAGTAQLAAKLETEDAALPILSLNLSGQGRHPQLQFDRDNLLLPATPLHVSSSCCFHVINDGYDNLDLKYRLPADTQNLPIELSFPEGTMIGIAKASVPVVVSFTATRATSFTANIEFMDQDGAAPCPLPQRRDCGDVPNSVQLPTFLCTAGSRYNMPVTGCADRSALTLQPFLLCNEGMLDWHVEDDGAVSLATDVPYNMPTEPLLLALPSIPPLFVAYLNSTTLKGPFVDLQKESMQSKGKVTSATLAGQKTTCHAIGDNHQAQPPDSLMVVGLMVVGPTKLQAGFLTLYGWSSDPWWRLCGACRFSQTLLSSSQGKQCPEQ